MSDKCEICGTSNKDLLKKHEGHVYCSRCWQSDEVCQKCRRKVTMPKRKWSKYLNSQKYSECQIITALNAYYHLTGKVYCQQDSQEYEDLVDSCCARIGAAIGIEKIHRKLGLRTIGYASFLSTSMKNVWLRMDAINRRKAGKYPKKKSYMYESIKGKKIDLPIEMMVWHKKTGFHSTLIVDHCLQPDTLRVTNFKHVTSNEGWIFAEDLYQYVNKMNKGWCFRLFGLKNV